MPSANLTYSESLFRELCDLHDVHWYRLPELQDRRQPDYELRIDGQPVVAEIKQIESNDSDRALSDALRLRGRASGVFNPDVKAQRVRDDIRLSRGQFRAYLENNPNVPALLVIFDATDSRYHDPYIIQTAMHGFEAAVISTSGGRAVVVEQGFASRNNSSIRHDVNRHLSALVTMHEFADFDTRERKLGLRFYHNQYADTPFPVGLWRRPDVVHLKLADKIPGKYQDWEPVE